MRVRNRQGLLADQRGVWCMCGWVGVGGNWRVGEGEGAKWMWVCVYIYVHLLHTKQQYRYNIYICRVYILHVCRIYLDNRRYVEHRTTSRPEAEAPCTTARSCQKSEAGATEAQATAVLSGISQLISISTILTPCTSTSIVYIVYLYLYLVGRAPGSVAQTPFC